MAIDMKLENVLEMNPGEAPVLCFGTTLTNAQCSVPIGTRWRAHEARISYLLRKTKWQHERARRSSTSQSSHSSSDVIRDEVLEELASFMLCFRHNEKQGPKIVKKWRREIELRLEKSSRSPALSMSQGTLSSNVHLREQPANLVPILQRMSARIEARFSRQEIVTLTRASSPQTAILSSRRHQTARNSLADHRVSSRTRHTRKEDTVTNRLTSNSKGVTTTVFTRKPISNKNQKKELHPKKRPEEKKEEKKTIGSRLPIKPGDECPICFETLLKRSRGRTVENGNLAWCRKQCGSNYHQACISKWIDHSSRELAEETYESNFRTIQACIDFSLVPQMGKDWVIILPQQSRLLVRSAGARGRQHNAVIIVVVDSHAHIRDPLIAVVGAAGRNNECRQHTSVCGFVFGNNPGEHDNGSFAEYVVAVADLIWQIPPEMSFEAASTLDVGVGTVGMALYNTLQLLLPMWPARPPPTSEVLEYVLVYGGGTATDGLAIQMIRMSGLIPIITCAPHNFRRVKSLGSTMAFDYNSPSCRADIRTYTKGTLKFAFDCVSYTESMKICYNAIGIKGGKYIALDQSVSTRTLRSAGGSQRLPAFQ